MEKIARQKSEYENEPSEPEIWPSIGDNAIIALIVI
jgi:hypothetical protein